MAHARYVGSPEVWIWQEIPTVGCVGPRAVADIGFAHFIVAQDGFYLYDGARPVQVGTAEIRQWFAENVNRELSDKIECVFEQDRNRVWVFFPYVGGDSLNKALCYHIGTKQWGLADYTVQTSLVFIEPGVAFDSWSGTYDTSDAGSFDQADFAARSLAVFSGDTLYTLTGVPGSSYFQTHDIGDPAKASRLTEAYVGYAIRPTTASCGAYASFALGGIEDTGPTVVGYDEYGSSNTPGRFTLRQHARWHRLQFNFTGTVRVTEYTAKITPTGGR
jgi:hypothetical protein